MFIWFVHVNAVFAFEIYEAVIIYVYWKVNYYIMAGHAIVVVKDIILLFYHGNAVILTLR